MVPPLRMPLPLLLSLLLAVGARAATQQSGGGACSSAEDCSLGGECVSAACVCDKTWTGAHCAALNLGKAPKVGAYRHNANGSTSWGGLPVLAADKKYHLFFAEFANGCGLGSWGTNSQVLKAVSTSPSGPFTDPTVVAPPFHHNPTIAKIPGGPYLMVSIGNGSTPWRGIAPPKESNCSGPPTAAAAKDRALAQEQRAQSGDPLLAYEITMLYSDSVEGPWKHRMTPVLEPGPATAWDGYVTNPSLYVYPNGSVLLAYRGGPCPIPKGGKKDTVCNAHRVSVAFAERWDGEYKRMRTAPAFTEQNEDPGIFRDKRGNFHMITHYFAKEKTCGEGHTCQGPGGHAFSANGLDWEFAGQAYDSTQDYEDGSKEQFSRRERPQVLMVDGEPAFLFNGVLPQNSQLPFTLVTPICTGKPSPGC
jgi:hypothetical protein